MSTERLRRIISILGIGALLLPMLSLLVQPTNVAMAQGDDYDPGSAPVAEDDYYSDTAGVTTIDGQSTLEYFNNAIDGKYYVGWDDVLDPENGAKSGFRARGVVDNNDTDGNNDFLSVYLGGGLGDPVKANGQVMTEEDYTAGERVMGIKKTTSQGGSVVLYWTGAFIYTPPVDMEENYVGVDSFTYRVTDGTWVSEDPAEVRIELLKEADSTGVAADDNEDPEPVVDLAYAYKNEPAPYDVLNNDIDDSGYGDNESMMLVSGYGAGFGGGCGTEPGTELTGTDLDGTFTMDEYGQATYTPATDAVGVEVFTYCVSDGFQQVGNESYIAFTVYDSTTQQLPIARGSGDTPYVVYQDQTLLVSDSVTLDSDGESAALDTNTKLMYDGDTDVNGNSISVERLKDLQFEFRLLSLPENGKIFRTLPLDCGCSQYDNTFNSLGGTDADDNLVIAGDGLEDNYVTESDVSQALKPDDTIGKNTAAISYTATTSDDVPLRAASFITTGTFKYIPDPLPDTKKRTDSFEYFFVQYEDTDDDGTPDNIYYSSPGTVEIEVQPLTGAPQAKDDTYKVTDTTKKLKVHGYADDTFDDDNADHPDPLLRNDVQGEDEDRDEIELGLDWDSNSVGLSASQPYSVELSMDALYGTVRDFEDNPEDGTEESKHPYTILTRTMQLGRSYADDDDGFGWLLADGGFQYKADETSRGKTDEFYYRFRDWGSGERYDNTNPGILGRVHPGYVRDLGALADNNVDVMPKPVRDLYSTEGKVSVSIAKATTAATAEDDQYGYDINTYPPVYQDLKLRVPGDPPEEPRVKHPYMIANDKDGGVTGPETVKEIELVTRNTETGDEYGPFNGVVQTLSNQGGFEYFPNVGFIGEDSFVYQFNGKSGQSDTATVKIKVTLYGDAPSASDDEYEVIDGTAVAVVPPEEGQLAEGEQPGLLDNDTPAPSGFNRTTRYADLYAPRFGEFDTNADDGSFTYTPNQGYTGNDVGTYWVQITNTEDNTEVYYSKSADFTFDVGNIPPIARDISYQFIGSGSTMDSNDNAGDTNQIIDSIVTRLGVDEFNAGDTSLVRDRLEVAEIFGIEGNTYKGGTVSVDRNGDFVYTKPDGMAGESFVDKFPYTLYDGSMASNTAWVYIVVGDADHYTARDDHYVMGADQSTLTVGKEIGPILGNDSIIPEVNDAGVDVEVPLMVKLTGTSEVAPVLSEKETDLGGKISITHNGSFSYKPPEEAPAETYVDEYEYSFNDWDNTTDSAGDKMSNTATIYIHVGQDSIAIGNDVMYSTNEGTPLTVEAPGFLLTSTAYVMDGSALTEEPNAVNPNYDFITSVDIDETGSHGGTITMLEDGKGGFTYSPPAGFTGYEKFNFNFTFKASDDAAEVSTTDTNSGGTLTMYVDKLDGIELSAVPTTINARVPGIDAADTNMSTITANLYGQGGQTYPWLGIHETIEFTTTPVLADLTIAPTATTSMDTGTAAVSLTAGFDPTPSISVTGKTAWGLEDSVALTIDEPAYDITISGASEVAAGDTYTVTATVEPQVAGMDVMFSYSDGIVSSQEIMSDTTAIEDGHIFSEEGTAYISATLRYEGARVKTSNTISVTVLTGAMPAGIDLEPSTNQADITIAEDGEKTPATVELTATLKDALDNDFVFTGAGTEPDITWETTGGTLVEGVVALAAVQEFGTLSVELAKDVDVSATALGMVQGTEQTITDTVTISFRYVDEEGNPLVAGEEYATSEEIDPTSETTQTLSLNDIAPGVDLEATIPSDFLLGFGNVYVEIIPITINISGTVVIVAFDVNVYSEDGELLNDQITAFDKAIVFTFMVDATVANVSMSNGMLAVWTKQEPKNDINNWEDKGKVMSGGAAAVMLSQVEEYTVDVNQPGSHIVYAGGLGPVYLPRITK